MRSKSLRGLTGNGRRSSDPPILRASEWPFDSQGKRVASAAQKQWLEERKGEKGKGKMENGECRNVRFSGRMGNLLYCARVKHCN